jgi:8-oxo-dGTP diphosphatase
MLMELLLELTDINLHLADKHLPADARFGIRKAMRSVVVNPQNNTIALLFVAKYGYYKLPGGGVEPNEAPLDALKREVREETGCEVDIRPDCLGVIMECRDREHFFQISYCYLSTLIGPPAHPSFTQHEIDHGFTPQWHPLETAIELVSNSQTTNYQGQFIRRRDAAFLLKAREVLEHEA